MKHGDEVEVRWLAPAAGEEREVLEIWINGERKVRMSPCMPRSHYIPTHLGFDAL